jgi:GTPase Era involved in 16S rRNA processing
LSESQVLGILGTFNKLVYDDLKNIDITLSQMSALTANAYSQFHESMELISNAVDENHRLSLLIATQDQTPEVKQLLQILSDAPEQFQVNRNKIMLSMQSTDMVHQLLGQCRKRMNHICKMGLEAEQVTENHAHDFSAMVDAMQALLSEQRHKMEAEVPSAVYQVTVKEGEIELF